MGAGSRVLLSPPQRAFQLNLGMSRLACWIHRPGVTALHLSSPVLEALDCALSCAVLVSTVRAVASGLAAAGVGLPVLVRVQQVEAGWRQVSAVAGTLAAQAGSES